MRSGTLRLQIEALQWPAHKGLGQLLVVVTYEQEQSELFVLVVEGEGPDLRKNRNIVVTKVCCFSSVWTQIATVSYNCCL